MPGQVDLSIIAKPMSQKSKKQTLSVFGMGTVLERGQIIIPAKLRKSQNIKPGDTFVFMGTPGSSNFNVVNTKTFEGFTDDLTKLLVKDPEKEDKKK